MNLRQIALVGLAALALGGTAVAQVAPVGPLAQASPPPPAATPSARPSPSAAPASGSPAPARGRGRGRSAATPEPGASETPEPPQFSTMDGVWEVQLQPLDGTRRTVYSHLYVSQKGDQLTGTWARKNNDKIPFSGTFDGRLFKLTATTADKATLTLSGYAENFSDMVGLLLSTDPKDKGIPFTASHRKKERVGI